MKFRVNDLNAFDAVYFSINDSSGLRYVGLNVAAVRNWLGLAQNNWFVAYAYKTGNWTDWDNDNLRATLTALGTSNAANVGSTIVDVEWFAFGLTLL